MRIVLASSKRSACMVIECSGVACDSTQTSCFHQHSCDSLNTAAFLAMITCSLNSSDNLVTEVKIVY